MNPRFDLTLELSPYGFPIRVELRGGRARVYARDGVEWEDVGDARVRTAWARGRRRANMARSRARRRWMASTPRRG
ncbi:MAG: hypothetical protein U0271_14530 [Polyangiaceae bacterium]